MEKEIIRLWNVEMGKAMSDCSHVAVICGSQTTKLHLGVAKNCQPEQTKNANQTTEPCQELE